ncbi:Transcription factor, fungi [Penicillium expansum]|nr:Transcription factor, fungi [Penicillium expansum]
MTEELSGNDISVGRACDRCRKRKLAIDIHLSRVRSAVTGRLLVQIADPQDQTAKHLIVLRGKSGPGEGKIDQIGKRLSRLNHLVESLLENPARATNNTSSKHPETCVVSRPKPLQTTSASPRIADWPVRKMPDEHTDDTMLGQSSFRAQSTFAIDLARTVVGTNQPTGSNQEVQTLLDMLRHIGTAFNERHYSSRRLFPLMTAAAPLKEYQMPPIEAAVALLRKSEVDRNFLFQGLSFLLSPRILSDLCLKVYFAPDYSDIDFIIVNVALLFLASDPDIRNTNVEESGAQMSLGSMCQKNIEIALSKLTLYIQPSYGMTLALGLGVTYAIHVSNPILAGKQFLFWMIYFFEKTLSVRLGRSSIILDRDIDMPSSKNLQTTNTYVMAYFYQLVKLAGLAGRTYEQLYSANALGASENVRIHRALELSQELHENHAEARDENHLWGQSTSNIDEKGQIEFIAASDEVLRLSMLTLIYRAMPPGSSSRTTFGPECITSARCALESHQTIVRAFGMQESPLLLSAYVNWTILFTPFTPFIILFCHCIETRDKEDLYQMHTFLKSIECACQHSRTIAKHHHLFSVFYYVAVRYTELSSPSSAMEEEQIQLRSEVDAQLSALGLQPHTAYISSPNLHQNGLKDSLTMAIERNESDWVQDPWLERWFSFNQQMMGLLDGNDLPF